jgi:hypothetical protein
LDSNVNDVKEMHWEKHNLHMNSTAEGTWTESSDVQSENAD